MLYIFVVLLPLAGALLGGIFLRIFGQVFVQVFTCSCVFLSCILSIIGWRLFPNTGVSVFHLMPWIEVGSLSTAFAVRLDSLTLVMMFVVTSVSFLVHLYSLGYMARDSRRGLFMCYLSFFTAAMLILVSANDYGQLFLGWEGVGLASYLLIGFWYEKPTAGAAAMKAFIVNRIGDMGLLLGLGLIVFHFGSLEMDTVFAQAQDGGVLTVAGYNIPVVSLISFFLFIGAMGKSAQLGLHIWLPDAMEGPTPVSALIHAATMVTAGVFLLVRSSPLLEYAPFVLQFIGVIGALTAVFAATIAIVQTDIKRVIAYSTCSQLGYMIAACGLSAYGAALFHLFTHAFFKALLFLGAGAVIHVLHEQDLRRMGGLRLHLPFTHMMMWAGVIALMGVPFFSGYFSKDIIMESAFASSLGIGMFVFWSTLIAAVLTVIYSIRMMVMVFYGPCRVSTVHLKTLNEPSFVMLLPNFLLSLGSLFMGWLFASRMVGEGQRDFWKEAIFERSFMEEGVSLLEKAHHVSFGVKMLPLVAIVIGVIVSLIVLLKKEWIAGFMTYHRPLYRFLLNKWYIDELYGWIFIRPFVLLSRGAYAVDRVIFDSSIINKVTNSIGRLSSVLSKAQTGYLYHYAFMMVLGIFTLVSILFLMDGS